MTFEQAQHKIAVAGRELGSGPAAAVARIVGDLGEREGRKRLRSAEQMHQRFERRLFDAKARGDQESADRWETITNQHVVDAARCAHQGQIMAYGVAVGLVMAEQDEAMKILDGIHQEWRKSSA